MDTHALEMDDDPSDETMWLARIWVVLVIIALLLGGLLLFLLAVRS
ncbi:MAG TPA: hypothetical protein VK467_04525 [Gemmatimonadales bacterium]|nr:hypothetical protein [Gemmatimonadales bacterium]